METQHEWFTRVTRGRSIRNTAALIGVQQVTLNRQLANNAVTPVVAVKICEKFNADILHALQVIGLLTKEQAQRYMSREKNIREFSDLEIADEIYRRIIEYGEAMPAELRDPLTPVETPAPKRPPRPRLEVLQNTDEEYIDESKIAAFNPGHSITKELEEAERNQP